MPLCGRNWADSICRMVASTSCANSRRCSSVIVVCRYWISTRRLRTNTTWATSEMPVVQEFVLPGKRPHKLDLQVALRFTNANAILLAEAVEQLNALFEHAIPGIA